MAANPPPLRRRRSSIRHVPDKPFQPLSTGPQSGSSSGGVPSPRAANALLNLEGERFPTWDEIEALPDEIKIALRQLAMDYFKHRMYPRMLFLVKRKHRREAVRQALTHTPALTPSYLQMIPIFSKWVNLEALTRSMELMIVERDDFVTFQGDTSANAIYFLVSGTVTVRKMITGKGGRWAQQATRGGAAGAAGAAGSGSTSDGSGAASDGISGDRRGTTQMARANSSSPFLLGSADSTTSLLGGLKRKGYSDANTLVVDTLDAPCVYGEMVFLTDEPRTESLKAATRCLFWVLKRPTFFSYLHQNPDAVQRHVLDMAHRVRCDNIRTIFPLSGAQLKAVPLFSHVPEEQLNALAARCEPRVFVQDQTIARIGDVCHEFFFIVRGEISLNLKNNDGDVVHAVTGGAGTVIGELPALFVQKQNALLRTTVPTDVYAISRDSVVTAVPSQSLMSTMLQRAHAAHAEWQNHAKTRYREFISNIPMLKEHATAALIDELLTYFQPRVFPVHSTIVTVSEVASRVVIPTRGKGRLTSGSVDLAIGEAIGFTCLIPHRWLFHAVALETVETIELGYEKYAQILKKHDVFAPLKQLTLGLLYPRCYPDAYQRVVAMVRSCRNPPCFPTSSSFEVHPFAARSKSNAPAVITPADMRRRKAEIGGLASMAVRLPPLSTTNGAAAPAASDDWMWAETAAPSLAATEAAIEAFSLDPTAATENDRMGRSRATRSSVFVDSAASSAFFDESGSKKGSAVPHDAAARRRTGGASVKLAPLKAAPATKEAIAEAKRKNAEVVSRLTEKIAQLKTSLGIAGPKKNPTPAASPMKASSPSAAASPHRTATPQADSSPKQAPPPDDSAVGCEAKAPDAMKRSLPTTTRTIAMQTKLSYLRSRALAEEELRSRSQPAGGGASPSAPPQRATNTQSTPAAAPEGDAGAGTPPPAKDEAQPNQQPSDTAATAAAPPPPPPEAPLHLLPCPRCSEARGVRCALLAGESPQGPVTLCSDCLVARALPARGAYASLAATALWLSGVDGTSQGADLDALFITSSAPTTADSELLAAQCRDVAARVPRLTRLFLHGDGSAAIMGAELIRAVAASAAATHQQQPQQQQPPDAASAATAPAADSPPAAAAAPSHPPHPLVGVCGVRHVGCYAMERASVTQLLAALPPPPASTPPVHLCFVECVDLFQEVDMQWILGSPCAPTLESLRVIGSGDVSDASLGSLLLGLPPATIHGLDLSCSARVTDAGLSSLPRLTSLTTLDLSHCSELTDAALVHHVSGCTGLTSLVLSHCPLLTDAGIEAVRTFTGLRTLSVAHCPKLTDASLLAMTALTALESVDVCGDELISDAGLAHLASLPQLAAVFVSDCPKVTDAGRDLLPPRCRPPA